MKKLYCATGNKGCRVTGKKGCSVTEHEKCRAQETKCAVQ